MKVEFDNNHHSLKLDHTEIPAIWLRERAQSSDQLDLQTQQRLFNPHHLAADLRYQTVSKVGDTLLVEFSDGYHGEFNLDAIAREIAGKSGTPAKILWKAEDDSKMPKFDWKHLDDPEQEYLAAKTYLQFGFILMHNTPLHEGGYFEVAKRFGFVKETAHGRSYHVVSKPDYNDLAYQPGALAPHTDMPYSNPMPGVQILQCRINETSGGLSTLVDSLACCAALKAEDDDAYQLLASIPVRFEFHSKDEMICLEHPILNLDPRGNVTGVRYSPRLDYMPLLDEQTLSQYQRARQRLGELFSNPAFELCFRLEQGDAIMFDNSRVLHGRTSYDPREGHRHLEGGYLDGDGPRIRFNTLKRDFGFN